MFLAVKCREISIRGGTSQGGQDDGTLGRLMTAQDGVVNRKSEEMTSVNSLLKGNNTSELLFLLKMDIPLRGSSK